MEKPTITINDLALALGTSASTVSRALKNHPKISSSMKEKVRAMAIKMGYVHSIQATIQQNFQKKIVGIIVPNFTSSKYTSIINSAQKVFEREGYQVLICCSMESAQNEKEIIELFDSVGVQGILASLTLENKNPDHFHTYVSRKPLVLFDRISFDIPCKKVIIDSFQAGFRAVQHLLKNNCRRIAHLGGDVNCPLTKQISAGYKTALKKDGIKVNPKFEVFSDQLAEDVTLATEIIYNQTEKPDAFLVDDFQTAQKLISILQALKISIPNDVSVIALGDEKDYMFYSPSITTIHFPYSKLGKKAAGLLLDELGNDTPLVHDEIFVEAFELKIRNSTLKI